MQANTSEFDRQILHTLDSAPERRAPSFIISPLGSKLAACTERNAAHGAMNSEGDNADYSRELYTSGACGHGHGYGDNRFSRVAGKFSGGVVVQVWRMVADLTGDTDVHAVGDGSIGGDGPPHGKCPKQVPGFVDLVQGILWVDTCVLC